MEYRRLGSSGLRLSLLSFGSWVTFSNQCDQKLAQNLMAYCYEHGVNFFDNAEVYADGQSEIIMGQALKALNWSRDSYTVSSKVFWGGNLPTQRGLNRKHIYDACHAALKRLQVDYLDLFFCHRPDFHTPMEETVRAMTDLISQGKILYWGCSEWTASQIMQAHMVARQFNLVPPTMEQPQYNLLHRDKMEKEYLDVFNSVGLGTTIWSPLASGVLTGKYNNVHPNDTRTNLPGYEWLKNQFNSKTGLANIEKAKKLTALAESLDTSLTKLSIAWCAKNPNVSTVILGASKMTQLEENLKALEILDLLNPEIMSEIDKIVQNKPEPAKDWLM